MLESVWEREARELWLRCALAVLPALIDQPRRAALLTGTVAPIEIESALLAAETLADAALDRWG